MTKNLRRAANSQKRSRIFSIGPIKSELKDPWFYSLNVGNAHANKLAATDSAATSRNATNVD